MTRPLRLEFAGALYHITARGDRREDIFFRDQDRTDFLTILSQVCARFNWVVHAYCLMTNHYHLLVETVDGNLSRGMRQLNGVYTQHINRNHNLPGHLFQGRYKAILVQKEAYLLELSRYVVLNPVRANMVANPEDWQWSSYRTVIGEAPEAAWLDSEWLLSQFGSNRQTAVTAYRHFVLSGLNKPSPLLQARHQVLLGDESFVSSYLDEAKNEQLRDISKAQRRAIAQKLPVYQQLYKDRDEAMARAYLSGAYTMKEIAVHFGVHYMTVSRSPVGWAKGATPKLFIYFTTFTRLLPTRLFANSQEFNANAYPILPINAILDITVKCGIRPIHHTYAHSIYDRNCDDTGFSSQTTDLPVARS